MHHNWVMTILDDGCDLTCDKNKLRREGVVMNSLVSYTLEVLS